MVEIKRKIYDKIFRFAKAVKEDEIGGLLLGRTNRQGEITINGIVLLKQQKTVGAFEIDEEDMMEFTKTADDRTLKSVIGWWHSHGHGNSYWSTDDSFTFKRLCNFLQGRCVGIVVTHGQKDKYRARIDVKKQDGEILNIDAVRLEITGFWEQGSRELTQKEEMEIKNKVKTAVNPNDIEVSTYSPCPFCQGQGYVPRYSKNYQQDNKYLRPVKKGEFPEDDLFDDYIG